MFTNPNHYHYGHLSMSTPMDIEGADFKTYKPIIGPMLTSNTNSHSPFSKLYQVMGKVFPFCKPSPASGQYHHPFSTFTPHYRIDSPFVPHHSFTYAPSFTSSFNPDPSSSSSFNPTSSSTLRGDTSSRSS